MKIMNYKVEKRTFEGLTDPEKNKDPRTSKYYPSHKWIAIYDVVFDHGGTATMTDTFKTKKEAVWSMEIRSGNYDYMI